MEGEDEVDDDVVVSQSNNGRGVAMLAAAAGVVQGRGNVGFAPRVGGVPRDVGDAPRRVTHASSTHKQMGKVDENKFREVCVCHLCCVQQAETLTRSVRKQVLRLMRDQNHSMHKACVLAGLKQQTVYSRFKKNPLLYEIVFRRAEIADAMGEEEDEDAPDAIDEVDVAALSRGRGRKNDVPLDVEEAIARKICKAIQRLNAPTTFAIIKKLVQKVCLLFSERPKSVTKLWCVCCSV